MNRGRLPEARTVLAFALTSALAVTLAVAAGSVRLAPLAVAVGLGGVTLWLATSRNLAFSLAVLTLYLGLVDGYLKLRLNTPSATLVRDLLLYAIAFGAFVRMAVQRDELRIPPLTGWVLVFTCIVLVQVFNPASGTWGHALASVRPHVEFVPLFFLGYATMRSKRRLRGFLVLIVLIAAVNGVVAFIQFNLSAQQFASWGPGYSDRIYGTGTISGRSFLDASGNLRPRPFGLGGDAGFAGIVGLLAATAALALAIAPGRRIATVPLVALTGGVVLGIVTSQARVALVSSVIAILAFALLASAARRIVPVMVALALAVAMTAATVSLVKSNSADATFRKYDTVAPNRVVETTIAYRRATFQLIPKYAVDFPLGAGIGSTGPAGGYGGVVRGDNLNAESEPTYLLIELGIPGLIALLAFNLKLFALAIRRIRPLADPELRLLLAAIAAPLFAVFASWVVGIATASTPTSPYFWFTAGILAYWLVGDRRAAAVAASPALVATPHPGPRAVPERPPAPPGTQPAPPRIMRREWPRPGRRLRERAAWAVGAHLPTPPSVWVAAGVLAYLRGRRERDATHHPRRHPAAHMAADLVPPPTEGPPVVERFEPPSWLDEPRHGPPELAAEPEADVAARLRVAVVYRGRPGAVDGIRDHSERLVAALCAAGTDADLVLFEGRRLPPELGSRDAVVLQYNPFSYGRWGFAPWLPRVARRLARSSRLVLLVHEPYVPLRGVRGTVMGTWQRLALRRLRHAAAVTLTSIQPWTEMLARPGRPVGHLPVGSTLPDMRSAREVERARMGIGNQTIAIATFGTDHPSRDMELVREAVLALRAAGANVVVLNLGAGAPPLGALPEGTREERPGELPAAEVARRLAAADVFLAPFIDGVSTRRTSVMAALQHELPVVATSGPSTDPVLRHATDALRLVPLAERRGFVAVVVGLAQAPDARRALGSRARELYEERFDWPVIAERLLDDLRADR